MEEIDHLRLLCYDDRGELKDRMACRAAIINHFILEELLDVDEAEDRTDDILQQLQLWNEDENAPLSLEDENELSTTKS